MEIQYGNGNDQLGYNQLWYDQPMIDSHDKGNDHPTMDQNN